VVAGSLKKKIAAKNVENMRSLATRINSIKAFKAPRFKATHFNEFVVSSKHLSEKVHRHLLSEGIQGGYVLDRAFPELRDSALYATTEMHSKADHDRLVKALEGVR